MTRRAAGVAFCTLAFFVFSLRYFIALLVGSRLQSWDPNLFAHTLVQTGGMLWASGFSFILGVLYLFLAEFAGPRSTETGK